MTSASLTPRVLSLMSVADTDLSDHRVIELYISHNTCCATTPDPPNFIDSSFRSLDFEKADYPKINSLLGSVDWTTLWDTCDDDTFPELFTRTVLEICEKGCPKKKPVSKKKNRCIRALSRKKRKLQAFLQRINDNPHSPNAQREAVKRKLYEAHIKIRDAINSALQYREQQAVNRIKENPKYFYSYAKRFSRKSRNISMLFDDEHNIRVNPHDIANLLLKQFTSVFTLQ